MRHGLDRPAFETRMRAVASGNQSFIDAMLSYPKSTQEVCTELVQRHFSIDVPALQYFVKQGIVSPRRTGRNRQWSKSDVDYVADLLETRHQFNAIGFALLAHQVDAAQDSAAFLGACQATGCDRPEDFVRIIHPSERGACEIEYLDPGEFYGEGE